jgi:hypothetical protein
MLTGVMLMVYGVMYVRPVDPLGERLVKRVVASVPGDIVNGDAHVLHWVCTR